MSDVATGALRVSQVDLAERESKDIMRTISASKIEQRGLRAVHTQLCSGPVHVLANDEPTYVIMTEAHYEEFVYAWHEAQELGIKQALEVVAAGRARRYDSVEELIRDLGLAEQCID